MLGLGGRRLISPKELLETYRVSRDAPLYVVGAYDNHITALSQQIRALNLAYAAIEAKALPGQGETSQRIAIIGAGFTGLTLAAGLLQKESALEIEIFEAHDTLIPLQQGSDSRWLHPQIYNWPDPGSETSAAMLPVLNWTAGRASDVVVQVLAEWRKTVTQASRRPRLFCNTRHLQVTDATGRQLRVEWVGEERDPAIGVAKAPAAGEAGLFDHVFMTVGFGIEKDNAFSYWRNETYGQPGLGGARTTYVVSGQGDGAMIDLLRLSISQFRQDRILDELFTGQKTLFARLEQLKAEVYSGAVGAELFNRFESLGNGSDAEKSELKELLSRLRRRLRRDTEVILQTTVSNLAQLFDGRTSRLSFQNALLVYLVYRCGGFSPSHETVDELKARYAIGDANLIIRRGTDRTGQFARVLSKSLMRQLERASQQKGKKRLRQDSKILWSGGYFGTPGRSDQTPPIGAVIRKTWRKEYLPGPTALVATSIAGALAGIVRTAQPDADQFRVVVHRVVTIAGEDLLQQSCEYVGAGLRADAPEGAARVFPSHLATIGQAYQTQSIIRSKRKVSKSQLSRTMSTLNLSDGASAMSAKVGFVLTVPILQPFDEFFGPTRVAGVVYIDSQTSDFWLDDKAVAEIRDCVQASLAGLQAGAAGFARLRNVKLNPLRKDQPTPHALEGAESLEILDTIAPPATTAPFHFNFEHSDLTPILSS